MDPPFLYLFGVSQLRKFQRQVNLINLVAPRFSEVIGRQLDKSSSRFNGNNIVDESQCAF